MSSSTDYFKCSFKEKSFPIQQKHEGDDRIGTLCEHYIVGVKYKNSEVQLYLEKQKIQDIQNNPVQ